MAENRRTRVLLWARADTHTPYGYMKSTYYFSSTGGKLRVFTE